MKQLVIRLAIISLSSSLLFSCSYSENANNSNVVSEAHPNPSSSPIIQPAQPSLPLPPSTPVPSTSSEDAKTNVRLRVVATNGEPAGNVAVAFVGNAFPIPDAVTGYDGKATVEGVPCGKKIVIQLWQKLDQFIGTIDMFEKTVHTTYLKCGKGISNLGDLRIKCICPDCRPNRVIRSARTDVPDNQPCKPEKNR